MSYESYTIRSSVSDGAANNLLYSSLGGASVSGGGYSESYSVSSGQSGFGQSGFGQSGYGQSVGYALANDGISSTNYSVRSAGGSMGKVNQIASDLLLLNGSGSGSGNYSSYSNSAVISGSASASASASGSVYLSEIESAILRSTMPIEINESEEITVIGQRGIWANKGEVINWRGVIPITQYVINEDSNPEIINKKVSQSLEYIQELAIRYLRPPTPPAPGEIIIKQEANIPTPPAPPLIIRQQPARPATPEPLVIREAPPQPPAQVGRKLITISGKRIPPAPRKVVIERLPALPSKPQSVLIERWLPYSEVKRRVVFQANQVPDPVVVKPRNVIVQWVAPDVNIKKEIKYLGVIKANPAEYVSRYGSSLKASRELPQYVLDIATPDGLVLAANYQYSAVHELEGDVSALRLIDLEREGLGIYRSQLSKFGYSSIGISSGENSYSTGAIISGGYSSGGYSSGGSYSFGSGNSSAIASGSSSIIAQMFAAVDADSNGNISVSEAEKILLRINSRLSRSYGEDDVRNFFRSLDKNNDGVINLEEFRAAFERSF